MSHDFRKHMFLVVFIPTAGVENACEGKWQTAGFLGGAECFGPVQLTSWELPIVIKRVDSLTCYCLHKSF